jgi:hypothetical protein
MPANTRRIVNRLGANVGCVTDAGGGAFGPARLTATVEPLRGQAGAWTGLPRQPPLIVEGTRKKHGRGRKQ